MKLKDENYTCLKIPCQLSLKKGYNKIPFLVNAMFWGLKSTFLQSSIYISLPLHTGFPACIRGSRRSGLHDRAEHYHLGGGGELGQSMWLCLGTVGEAGGGVATYPLGAVA
jgi:hypothetical protein